MKLYLVHAGFYDDNVSSGFYESHTNYFVVADNVKSAKLKARSIKEYRDKKMHIDGIMEVNEVDGYNINLLPIDIGNESGVKSAVKKVKDLSQNVEKQAIEAGSDEENLRHAANLTKKGIKEAKIEMTNFKKGNKFVNLTKPEYHSLVKSFNRLYEISVILDLGKEKKVCLDCLKTIQNAFINKYKN